MLTFLALKSRRRVMFIGLLVLVLPIMLAAMPEQWWDRMATITSDNPDSSVLGRYNAWSMTWNLALDRPVFGGGFAIYEPDVFARYAPDPTNIHSALFFFFRLGGEGLFFWPCLFLLFSFLRRGRGVIGEGPQRKRIKWGRANSRKRFR